MEDGYEALRGADALAVVTEWNEFRTPDFQKMKKLMKKPVIFDGRNIYNQEELRKAGIYLLRHREKIAKSRGRYRSRERGRAKRLLRALMHSCALCIRHLIEENT